MGCNWVLKPVIDRKKKGKVRWGRRHSQLQNELKEKGRRWNLKEEALDLTLWRASSGRGFGPFARQAKRGNECCSTVRSCVCYWNGLLSSNISCFTCCKGVRTLRCDKISCHAKLKVKMTILTVIGISADILRKALVRYIDMLTAHDFNFR